MYQGYGEPESGNYIECQYEGDVYYFLYDDFEDCESEDEEDEFGDVKHTMYIPSGIYNHLACMADDAEMSLDEYILQMAVYGHIETE